MKEILTFIQANKDNLVDLFSAFAMLGSVIAFILNVYLVHRMEARQATRQLIQPDIISLGVLLYELIATSRIYLEKKENLAKEKWRTRANQAKGKLVQLRPRLRYSLWGMDKPIRQFTRLPDWVAHIEHHPRQAKLLLFVASEQRAIIDRAALRAYREGRPPSIWQRVIANLNYWMINRIRIKNLDEE